MGTITVKEMVKVCLIANGYTGLVGDDCGCEINDLMPCDAAGIPDCEAGYKHLCKKCPAKKGCEVEGGNSDGGTYCISVSKDAPKEAR